MITHFFIEHDYLHNIIFIIIGLLSVYYFRFKILTKKNLIFLFLIFSIIFVAFIIFKTHDDFGYYHFPYSHYLNKFSMIIGIGPLNHGFKTPSSIHETYPLGFWGFWASRKPGMPGLPQSPQNCVFHL